jgi:hypothetical protein
MNVVIRIPGACHMRAVIGSNLSTNGRSVAEIRPCEVLTGQSEMFGRRGCASDQWGWQPVADINDQRGATNKGVNMNVGG